MITFDLILLVFLIFWSLVIMFITCMFGERLTIAFEQFSDALYQSDWHSFPIQMQQILLILMVNAQQPVRLTGFANTLCALESFNKVIFVQEDLFMPKTI